MPIPFTCPHCNKQMSVPDQFAGQSGPCQACGKPINIPGSPRSDFVPPPKSSSSAGLVIGILLAVGFVGLLCIGCLVALLLPAVSSARSAARRIQATNNLKQLGLALHNYHDVYGRFPPAVVRDADGNPLYSGRVLLLPYMEQQGVFQQWKQDEAWDSPANQALSDLQLPVFRDPAATSSNGSQTDYLFIVGPSSIFEEQDGGISIADVTDGTSNTILMMEVKDSNIHWAEPEDIDVSSVWPQQGNHPGVVLVLMADGSVRTIANSVDPAVIKSMATRNGGEEVNSIDY